MLKKTITYFDFDGNERTETHYFNLTQTELIEMSMDLPDGVTDAVGGDPANIDKEAAAMKIFEKIGNKGALQFMKDLVLKSYGVKSEDGRRFEKSPELTKEFEQTLAYDAMLVELMSDDEAASNFVNAVIPTQMINKMIEKNQGNAVLPLK